MNFPSKEAKMLGQIKPEVGRFQSWRDVRAR